MRIAFRVIDEWVVFYLATLDGLDDALELGRILKTLLDEAPELFEMVKRETSAWMLRSINERLGAGTATHTFEKPADPKERIL